LHSRTHIHTHTLLSSPKNLTHIIPITRRQLHISILDVKIFYGKKRIKSWYDYMSRPVVVSAKRFRPHFTCQKRRTLERRGRELTKRDMCTIILTQDTLEIPCPSHSMLTSACAITLDIYSLIALAYQNRHVTHELAMVVIQYRNRWNIECYGIERSNIYDRNKNRC